MFHNAQQLVLRPPMMHEDTGEIEARGNVKMSYRDDPGANRAGNVRIRLEKLSQ
jgi:hypothetical protein